MEVDGRLKTVLSVGVIALLIINLSTTFSLKEENKDLKNSIDAINSNIRIRDSNLSSEISDSHNKMSEKIDKGASLLSSGLASVKYENKKLFVTVSFEPKLIYKDEKIFVAIETGKGVENVEATTTDGIRYTAVLETDPCETINSTIIFEGQNTVKMEKIETVSVNEIFALGFESSWVEADANSPSDKNIIQVNLYPQGEPSNSSYQNSASVQLIIFDGTGTEVGREDIEDPNLYQLGLYPAGYQADLSKYFEKEGFYQVIFELITEDGFRYSLEAGRYENLGNGKSSKGNTFGGNNSQIIYPIW